MMSLRKRVLAATAVAGMAFSLAACGGTDDSSGSKVGEGASASAPSTSASQGAPKPVASLDAISGKTTAIKLDSGFTDALTSLKLTPGVTGTAKLSNGSLIFPITGGNVTVFKPGQVSPYVIGQIQHEGSGLTLAAGGTKVTLSNFNVDPGVSRVYGDVSVNGKVAATSAYLFTLDGSTLKPLKTSGTDAILTGTKVEISPVAAPLLNKTFGTSAVTSGLLVGIATITVDTTTSGS